MLTLKIAEIGEHQTIGPKKVRLPKKVYVKWQYQKYCMKNTPINPATRLLPLGEGGRVHIFAPIMVVVVSRTACHVYGI